MLNYANSFQTLLYEPALEHSDKRIYCIYQQVDENGQLLYTDEDHLTLSIYYLNEPELIAMPSETKVW